MYELPASVIQILQHLETSDAYSKLSAKYRQQKFSKLDLNEAIAYAQARMPATYSVIRYVLDQFKTQVNTQLQEEKQQLSEQQQKLQKQLQQNTQKHLVNILDVGAGVGALKIAIDDMLDDQVVYEAIEPSEAMRTVFRMINEDDCKIYVEDWLRFSRNKQYQMVFASYMINEVKDKKSAISKLFDLSSQYVVIIEPGTPSGYQHIVEAKRIAQQLGWYTVLPCAKAECGLQKGDWCHFSVRLHRTKVHAALKNAVLPYEDEKFCYVIFSKHEVDFYYNRTIIKKPIKKSGHTIFDICSKDGICRVVKTDKASKKLGWGDQLKCLED